MSSLSVVVITFNEEKNIERCLLSVKDIADEMLIVDSESKDRTREIAASLGAKVIIQPFLGYIEQKNFALNAAIHDYALSLDGDEALSPELAASIRAEKERGFQAKGYIMNRRNWFVDRWIKTSGWYPDKKLRLIHRSSGRWGGINPHDKLMLDSGSEPVKLKGDILHYTFHSMEDYVSQINKFSTISAKAMFEKGRRAGWFNLVWNPFIAFVKSYLISAGFKDGFYGYVIAKQTANLTFLKYAKLLRLQKETTSENKSVNN